MGILSFQIEPCTCNHAVSMVSHAACMIWHSILCNHTGKCKHAGHYICLELYIATVYKRTLCMHVLGRAISASGKLVTTATLNAPDSPELPSDTAIRRDQHAWPRIGAGNLRWRRCELAVKGNTCTLNCEVSPCVNFLHLCYRRQCCVISDYTASEHLSEHYR